MDVYLILIGIIITFSIFMESISKKLGVPTLLLFLLMGVLSGNGIFLNDFVEDVSTIEKICSIALIFIMFYGGFGTNIKEAKPVIKKAFFLSSVGVFITIGILSFLCHYVLKFDWAESFLLASVLGSTDAASVFNILRYKNLSLKNNLDSLLEVESGSNDPFAYMCTLMGILILKGDFNLSFGIIFLLKQVFFGVLVSFLVSKIYIYLFKIIIARNDKFNQIILISSALLSYSIANIFGGNGYLSTYFMGIYLGKFEFKDKRKVVHFFDGITSLMQLLLFYLLGLLVNPVKLLGVVHYGIFIIVVLTFVARPIAVSTMYRKIKAIITISFAGIRGAASIVFAMSALNSGAVLNIDIYHIVAIVVILSLIVQGVFLPKVVNKTDMLEAGKDILKTFNDYVYDKKVRFITTKVDENSPWKEKLLKQLHFPNDIRIVLINRNEETILPNGKVKIKEGDEVVLSGIHSLDDEKLDLNSVEIDEGHDWINSKIMNIKIPENEKILLIERNGRMLIPNGNVMIKNKDIVLLTTIKD